VKGEGGGKGSIVQFLGASKRYISTGSVTYIDDYWHWPRDIYKSLKLIS
jgi:UDP-N-acetylmuramate-alanine ligase